MFNELDLAESLDFPTFATLGNTGAVALPLTMALAAEAGRLERDHKVAMLGIGSGVNCQMLGVVWQESVVGGDAEGVRREKGAEGPLMPLASRQC
jgi:3-oxoacyl-[acyl-carrier-protein] synthase-3